ncbi:MAG TPA: PIN domain-containing protein [Candidatus Saccharimonadales bacterium]
MNVKQKTFLDTNVLVYQFDRAAIDKQKKAVTLIEKCLKDDSAVISTQVVQEFINVAVKKFDTQLPTREVDVVVTNLLKPLCAHYPTLDFYKRALSLYSAHSLSFYDALIIQAAIDLGCDIVYSEDLQDGQQFGNLTIINPFH